jgi:DNA-binding protein HU-beta
MAATRKSAKRTAAKKRTSAKRAPAKKSTRAKASSKRRTKGITKKAGTVGKARKKARKVVRAARGPINRVMNAGGKTWKALKSTTAHMVEGVRDTFGGDESSSH